MVEIIFEFLFEILIQLIVQVIFEFVLKGLGYAIVRCWQMAGRILARLPRSKVP